MSHTVESCPLTKLNGGLSRLHSADEDAVSWLTSYGSWNTYEKKTANWYKWMMGQEREIVNIGGQGQGHRRPKWVTRSVSVRYLKNCPTYQTWQAHITINAIASWRPRCKSSTRSRSCEAKLPLQSFVPPTPQCQLAFLVLYDAADWFVCTSAVCCLERLISDMTCQNGNFWYKFA